MYRPELGVKGRTLDAKTDKIVPDRHHIYTELLTFYIQPGS